MKFLLLVMLLFVFGCGQNKNASPQIYDSKLLSIVTSEPPPNIVKVLYGTNRKRDPQSNLNNADYLDERSNTFDRKNSIELGYKNVLIPPSHKKTKIERRSVSSFFYPDECFFQIINSGNLDYSEFKAAVRNSKGDALFIYIHGYNNTFEDAIFRAAQLTTDLESKDLTLTPVIFSWPSGSTTKGFDLPSDYLRAWTNKEWAKKDLADFLLLATENKKSKNVFILAHSLGAGLLGEALEQIRIQEPKKSKLFNQIILVGADIDTQTFKNVISPQFQTLSRKTTIYASNNDNPLKTSKSVHVGHPRLGDSSDLEKLTSINNLRGIDAIEVNGVKFNLFGHSYYAEMESTLIDITSVMRGIDIEKRTASLSNDKGFWSLPKAIESSRFEWQRRKDAALRRCPQ
ncbi:hypothetical protein WH96_06240 [Kiloniella spongiae]|uniref:Alpha/beta hydrolase n=1 Tax=Kiloniella spongiae TaxID=1489064 RepID=A0A0H2MI43_9PROT|nr:alpha/beta hydrolase [Kiloniella spongiae]KLN61871.1 hypothetical protein WH96_06240 [Kiloniella spongiae]